MIIATAGHVDHGKTSLVKQLTGMETDCLVDEKRRGLSINLGFAHRELKNGAAISFIDVPGHNRFINTMIAGVSGIDLGMLVVAADDGLMPQTIEHMDVLTLLGVTRFILVMTKIDRVTNEQVATVKKAAMLLFPEPDTTPVFEVSNTLGTGVAELVEVLELKAQTDEAYSDSGYVRLSVDRAFLIKGSGLVVTGTIASGSINVDESLTLVPKNRIARIRSLQVQGSQVPQAFSGQRCAVNITGDICRDDIERGDWLVSEELNIPTSRIDIRVNLLAHAPFALKHMAPVKLHIGAKRISARLALLEREEGKNVLSPGNSRLAQLLIDGVVLCCAGDRFLLRDDSESVTLGGGLVLDPQPPVSQQVKQKRLDFIRALEQVDAPRVLQTLLFDLKHVVDLDVFCKSWNIREDEMQTVLGWSDLTTKVTVLQKGMHRFVAAADHWQTLNDWLSKQLRSASHPTELHKLSSTMQATFSETNVPQVLTSMQMLGIIAIANNRVTLIDKPSELSMSQAQLWEKVEAYLLQCGAKIPVVSEVANIVNADQQELVVVIKLATKLKWLVVIGDNRLALTTHIKQFAEVAQQLCFAQNAEQTGFSIAEFKNECGMGRNLAVTVLEYFDKIGFTLRKEKSRVVLQRGRIAVMFG